MMNLRNRSSTTLSLLLSAFLCLSLMVFTTSSRADEIPITPNDEFFVISVDYFDIDPETYTLQVKGAVKNNLNLTLNEIRNMPVTSEIVRLSCISFKYGASDYTGVANWTGVKLSYILDLAEIDKNKVQDVSFHTPDLSTKGYSTSLNLDEAYWDDVILAYEMNGEPLPKEHGFPLRLVCPRFYGFKWIKWVALINLTTTDYKGFWERLGYDDSPYIDISIQIYYPLDNGTTSLTNYLGHPQLIILDLTGIAAGIIFVIYRKIFRK